MKLHTETHGTNSDRVLIVLHGLLGSSENWRTLGRRFGDSHHTILADLRNHGLSSHSDEAGYPEMASDVLEIIDDFRDRHITLMGHSMGGKVAMYLALSFPDTIDRLIAVDIAPKPYPGEGHRPILEAMQDLNLPDVSSRKEASELLEPAIPVMTIRQFLLKNLARDENGVFAWKANVDALLDKYDQIAGWDPLFGPFTKPTLMVRGSRSSYVVDSDLPRIRTLFPAASITTIEDAGHWVHAENPKGFFDTVSAFLTA